MDIPADPINIITYFFCPSKRDRWDYIKDDNTTNPSVNGYGKQDADSNHTCVMIPGFENNIYYGFR